VLAERRLTRMFTGEPSNKVRVFEIFLRMGVGMAIFIFGGYGIDRIFDTFPIFILLGTILGSAMVFLDLMFRSGITFRKGEKR